MRHRRYLAKFIPLIAFGSVAAGSLILWFTLLAQEPQNYYQSLITSLILVFGLITATSIAVIFYCLRKLHQRNAELHSALSQNKVTLESTVDGILLIDTKGKVVDYNKHFATMWKIPPSLLKMHDDKRLLDFACHQLIDEDAFIRRVKSLYSHPEMEDIDELYFKDGRVFERYSQAHWMDKKIVGRIWCFRDITNQKQMENLLQHKANHDSLTGLPNRDYLLHQIQHSIDSAKKTEHHFALIFFDLDNFKTINDSFGHEEGDEVLKAIADRLQHNKNPKDTLTRIGGDEFIILINEINKPEDCLYAVQACFSAFNNPFIIRGKEFKLTVSVGISIYPKDGSDAKTLLRSADIAMYKAKNAGRNNYQFYSEEMHKNTLANLHLENDLHHAFTRNEFFFQFQPTVDLQTGKVTSVEALIRWQHPSKGVILPKVFIPLVEEIGLTNKLSEWVLQQACWQMKEWQIGGLYPFKISINITNNELKNKNFIRLVDHTLLSYKIDPDQIEFELTEDILIESTSDALNVLTQLNSMHIALSIDDFGTGYSSLNYLKRLPIKKIKIDKDFIRDIPDNVEGMVIVKAIIAMSSSLGLTTTAEGVENQEQLNFLIHHQCQAAQGYHIAKPMDVAQCTQFLYQHMAAEK